MLNDLITRQETSKNTNETEMLSHLKYNTWRFL